MAGEISDVNLMESPQDKAVLVGGRGRGKDVAVHAVQDRPLCGRHHAQSQGGRDQKEVDVKREKKFR